MVSLLFTFKGFSGETDDCDNCIGNSSDFDSGDFNGSTPGSFGDVVNIAPELFIGGS